MMNVTSLGELRTHHHNVSYQYLEDIERQLRYITRLRWIQEIYLCPRISTICYKTPHGTQKANYPALESQCFIKIYSPKIHNGRTMVINTNNTTDVQSSRMSNGCFDHL